MFFITIHWELNSLPSANEAAAQAFICWMHSVKCITVVYFPMGKNLTSCSGTTHI